jgi:hypothetical protein
MYLDDRLSVLDILTGLSRQDAPKPIKGKKIHLEAKKSFKLK